MPSDYACDVPVLLVAFNRPLETERILVGIRAGRPKRLFMSIDGPRPGRPGETELVEQVARLAERVDWPCEVQVRRNTENLGCCAGVWTAISWLFENTDAGIIFEDDCLPDPTFFPYCEELLVRYADDEQVGMVAGSSTGLKLKSEASYGFSKYPYIWGWATWRRSWNLFDPKLADWPAIEAEGRLEAILSNPREIAFWKPRFASIYDGTERSVWDYQWVFAHFLHHMACIVPKVNLITNIGTGPQSTHTAAYDPYLHRPTSPMAFPMVHPESLVFDTEADLVAMRDRFSVKPFHRRVLGRLKREFQRRGS